MTNSTTLALPAALGLLASLAAQRLPELEPNNTVAQAQTLNAGAQVTANLAAAEQDWYQFTLSGAAEIHLRTSGNFGVNPSVDTGVFLFDATGTTRLAWNDNAPGNMSDLGVNLGAGTYTVMVAGKTASTTGDYGLDFVVLPGAVIHTNEGPEPNSGLVPGGVPTPITLGNTVAGSLSSPADADFYSFTLTERSVVQAICYDDGAVPQLDNTLLSFYQETGPGSWTAIGTASQLTTSHRSFNLAHPQTLAAGSYAIQVSAGTAAAGTAPFNYTQTGFYAIRTRLIAMPDLVQQPEGVEPNNTTTTAPVFSLGDTLTGFCSGSNEEDWWLFAVSGPTTIAAMADNGPSSPITDTTVKLYDANGTSITSASSGGPNSHGRLIFTIPEAGIYYLAVGGGLFAATGNYVVYTGSCDPMFVASAFSTTPPSTNACIGSNALRPALTAASTESPQLGSTFVVRLQNTLPNTIAVPLIGFSRTLAYSGQLPLPFDLAPVGAPGCFLRVDPVIMQLASTDAGGVGYIDFVLPPAPAVRGFTFFMQSMQLDAPLNPLGISMSNDVRVQVGDRGF
ncbi:MAG TPA: PPC domain-containing protein [Planctomycetota bacterium]